MKIHDDNYIKTMRVFLFLIAFPFLSKSSLSPSQYVVEIHTSFDSYDPGISKAELASKEHTVMTTKTGSEYSCFLPGSVKRKKDIENDNKKREKFKLNSNSADTFLPIIQSRLNDKQGKCLKQKDSSF